MKEPVADKIRRLQKELAKEIIKNKTPIEGTVRVDFDHLDGMGEGDFEVIIDDGWEALKISMIQLFRIIKEELV